MMLAELRQHAPERGVSEIACDPAEGSRADRAGISARGMDSQVRTDSAGSQWQILCSGHDCAFGRVFEAFRGV
jgi:hypothetical protein